MMLICDATLPPRVARALHLLAGPQQSVIHLRDAPGAQATDEALAGFVQSQPDAAVISMDLDMSDQPHRLAALREWGRPVFLLSTGWLELASWDFAWMLARLVPVMSNKARAIPGPAMYVVTPGLNSRMRKVA